MPSPSVHRACALLVDSDVRECQSRAAYLTRSGLLVEQVSDGRLALARAISQVPDVVVTQAELSGFSGYDLCRLLREDASTRQTPVIVITGDETRGARDRAEQAGADVVLEWPCAVQVLLEEVRRLIRRSAELRKQGAALSERVAQELARSRALQARSGAVRQRTLSRSLHRHETTTPSIKPPPLQCPYCNQVLKYQRSHVGGVSEKHAEQWDDYTCLRCGAFEYRQRTRKLRQIG